MTMRLNLPVNTDADDFQRHFNSGVWQSDLRKYALRLNSQAMGLTLEELEAAIWTFAND